MNDNALRILVTGGAGFIGSALIRHLISNTEHHVLNLDALTYAGNLTSLVDVCDHERYTFVEADICDRSMVERLVGEFRPNVIAHLAAESHVDRSIEGPSKFIQTNLVGTFTLLTCALDYWRSLQPLERTCFRFHHISTDEVFGALTSEGVFTELSSYDPRSPYSASKAGSDHLVRAWYHTYGLPVLVTNCSNNYGPFHFPEKLIPLTIIKCLAGDELPVYGTGENIRDWLYVDDHVRALQTIFERGNPGRTYMVGGGAERTNLCVVETICDTLQRMKPPGDGRSYRSQIRFVTDRPGHDFRYAVDSTKLRTELGWEPLESFDTGIERTVRWYLDNENWWVPICVATDAGQRLGLVT
jgi:dTDP-glucose 4,6-dehydratase